MTTTRLVGPEWTLSTSARPAILSAETEAEFAAMLDQALASGPPVEAPIEVLRAFGVTGRAEESAEAADIGGRPNLGLVPDRGRA